MTSNYNTSCDPVPASGCPLQLDTTCVFYHQWGQNTSKLPVLGIANGTNLEVILETIDTFLGANITYDYNNYSLPYLRSKYTVTNNEQFAEAVDVELQSIVATFNSSLNSIYTRLGTLETTHTKVLAPHFTDPCNIGIAANDDLFASMQKLINYTCSKCGSGTGSFTETPLTIVSNSLAVTQDASPGHNVILNVKISSDAGNSLVLTANGTGLFVPTPVAATPGWQTLGYNPGDGGLTISPNGNTVFIPLQQPQTLNFDCTSKLLTILKGGVVTGSASLSCLVTAPAIETPLVANSSTSITFSTSGTSKHTLDAFVKIAPEPNGLKSQANGLYVAPAVITGVNNGLTPAAGVDPIQWGGPLVKNTEVTNSTFNIGFAPRNFYVGNNIADKWTASDIISQRRYMQVINTFNHDVTGASSFQTVLDYNFNTVMTTGNSGSAVAGLVTSNTYNISADVTIPKDFAVAGALNILRIKNTGPGKLTMSPASSGGNRSITANLAFIVLDQGTDNTGEVTSAAIFRSGGFIQNGPGTNFTKITDAYGLILNEIGDIVYDHSKFVTSHGIYQQGVGDDNHYDADVTAMVMHPCDLRFKTDIQDFTGALDLINCINIKRYNLHRGKRVEPGIGMIAQQLVTVLPEVVRKKKTMDIDDLHVVDTFKLLAIAIKAIQELSDKINSLTTKA